MGNFYKLIGILFLLLTINIISALGVNAPYWEGNPLKMYAGETKEVSFHLVNGVNEKSAEASVFLVEGSEIAQITSGEKYTIQPGESDKNIILKIKIPEGTEIGKKYNVKFFVQYSPPGAEGNVQLNVKYNIAFPVETVTRTEIEAQKNTTNLIIIPSEKTKENNTKIIIIIAAIILILILLAIIIITIKKRKELKDNFK